MCLRVRTDLPCQACSVGAGWREMGRCLGGMAWFWPVPLGCCKQQVVLSAFSPPRFGVWRGCGLVGHARESPFVGARRFGQVQKSNEKVKRCNSGPVLAQACVACAASHGEAWANSGPTLQPEFNHQLTRYFPKFQNPKTTRAGSCLHVPVTDRDRPCLRLCQPGLPLILTQPPSLQAELPRPSLSRHPSSFLHLFSSSRLSSLVSRPPQLVGLRSSLSPSITSPAALNITFQIVITNSHRPIP